MLVGGALGLGAALDLGLALDLDATLGFLVAGGNGSEIGSLVGQLLKKDCLNGGTSKE